MTSKKWFFLLPLFSLWAQPSGPEVITGDVSFHASNNFLEIQASEKAIIEWDSFSISPNEITQFIQPHFVASVLNRVTGDQVSSILGQLKSNGHVLLINPQGVIFGENSQIDTASLTASTLDGLNNNFLNKSELCFEGSSREGIINHGSIIAKEGNVLLISCQVENHGDIQASSGSILIGCASKVLFRPNQEEQLILFTSEKSKAGEVGFLNQGTLSAIQEEIRVDGNLYDFAIRHEGAIDALGIVSREGRVLLIADNGTNAIFGSLSAKNADETGGSIQLRGEQIGVFNETFIDASGQNGGGKILVGGDFQGQSSFPNAKNIYIAPRASLNANAIENGNGGKIILWSDENTQFYGNISAKGGNSSGNGGFVEISSSGYLFPNGRIVASSIHDTPGTVLFDPTDVTVIASPGPPVESGFQTVPPPPPFVFTADTSVIFDTTITGILTGGTSVTIDTNNGLGGSGNVTVDTDLMYAGPAGANLTFNLAGNLFVNAEIENTTTGGGTITVNAPNGNVQIGGPLTGPPISTAATSILTDTSITSITCQNISVRGGTAVTSSSTLGSTSGTLIVNASGNALIQSGNIGTTNAIMTGTTIDLHFGGDLTCTTPAPAIVGAGLVDFPPPGGTTNIIVQRNCSLFGGLIFLTNSGLSMFVGGDLNVSGFSAGNIVTLGPSIDLFVGGNINLNPGAINTRLAPGTLRIRAGGSIFASGASVIASASDLTIVVDEQFSTSPGIGPGFVQFDPGATILSGSPLRIFTSIRSNNAINSFLDGTVAFVSGPFLQNNALEQWGIYFSSFSGDALGEPYTIYYKEGLQVLVAAAQPGFVASGELFRDLHAFDEWILWYMRFNEIFDKELNEKDLPFALPRRCYPHAQVLLPAR